MEWLFFMTELARTDKVKALSVGKFTVTRRGLILSGEPEWDDWKEFLSRLDAVHSSIQWVIGDALREIDVQYGEEGSQLTSEFPEREYKTLLNYRWVAGKIEYSRRRENLSFTHHALVASLERKEMNQWLEKASAKGWTVRELREELNPDRERKICPHCGGKL